MTTRTAVAASPPSVVPHVRLRFWQTARFRAPGKNVLFVLVLADGCWIRQAWPSLRHLTFEQR